MTADTGNEGRTGSYRETLQRLTSAQKAAAPGAPAYSIFINRRMGRLLAAVAYRAGLSPNGVTAISAAFTFSAIITLAIAPPSIVTGVVVWLLLAVGYALDSADGQLARLLRRGSRAGEWLDHVIDALKAVSLHAAVLVSFFRFSPFDDSWLLVPIGFQIVASGLFFAMILNDQLRAVHAAHLGRASVARTGSTLRRAVLSAPTDYGIICMMFVTLGFPLLFLIVYTLAFTANATYFILAARKWFGDMRALDDEDRGSGG